MEHVGDTMKRIKEVIERMKARSEDPEFQRQAARLYRETEEQKAHRTEADRRLRLQGSGVPYALWDQLRKPEDRPGMTFARAFLAAPPECVFLVLSGPLGRGKTFAASWLVDQCGGRMVDASHLVLLGTFDTTWKDLMDEPGVVAVDELGTEHRNDAFASSLYALLNHRYNAQHRTVLCTNLNVRYFTERYGGTDGRLADRLETAGMWVNVPGGESMRRPWQVIEGGDDGDDE